MNLVPLKDSQAEAHVTKRGVEVSVLGVFQALTG